LNNLIYTDYLDFPFIQRWQFVTKIAIGEVTTPAFGHPSKGGEIKPLPEKLCPIRKPNTQLLQHHWADYKELEETIRIDGGANARLLANVIEKALASDTDNNEDSTLKDQ
jgi:hypothetical protein